MTENALLRVKDLSVRFVTHRTLLGREVSAVEALRRVSFEVLHGETVGVLGESGCGKSTLAAAVAGLVPASSGVVEFDGHIVARHTAAERRSFGHAVQLVFQDPVSSLNPRMPVWETMTEPAFIQGDARQMRARRGLATQLAEQVGLNASSLERLPHEFSGGQRQRIAIARALSVRPRLVIFDEPTSALDVSVQAQILSLLLELQRKRGIAYLFISHNIAVINHVSDRILVMYRGEIVESGNAMTLAENPSHAYTRQLLAAVPTLAHGTPAAVKGQTDARNLS